jgi:endoglucanase
MELKMKIEILRDLCNLTGGSGDENAVRDYIYALAKPLADEIIIDNLGNMLVTKKGTGKSPVKVALTAHMDEVGFIITDIRGDGSMAFAAVGGVEPDVLLSQRVLIGSNPGVIGAKALHNMTDDERKAMPKFEDFSADIGTTKKSDTLEHVSLGDRMYFAPNFTEMGNGFISSKAIDDRFGCAVLLSLLERDFPCDVTFAFLVQEEVGCRGAKAAELDADCAFVIEATTAADFEGVSGDKRCCLAGSGAVVGFMDRSTVYDKKLFDLSRKVAHEHDIKWQTKTLIAGGNDASAINIKTGGIKTLAISIPCRYLHTANCVAKLSDMEAVEELAGRMVEKVALIH